MPSIQELRKSLLQRELEKARKRGQAEEEKLKKRLNAAKSRQAQKNELNKIKQQIQQAKKPKLTPSQQRIVDQEARRRKAQLDKAKMIGRQAIKGTGQAIKGLDEFFYGKPKKKQTRKRRKR